MSTITKQRLPGKLTDLVELKMPVAIATEKEYDETLKLIDRLMAIAKPTKGQSLYFQTLTDLVHCYEEKHHVIDTSDITPLDVLKSLMEEHGMNASDLARQLGVHVSLGSKILKGDRALTLEHIRILAEHFHISPAAFLG
jgi:Predicted transcription regulator containing HTH domain